MLIYYLSSKVIIEGEKGFSIAPMGSDVKSTLDHRSKNQIFGIIVAIFSVLGVGIVAVFILTGAGRESNTEKNIEDFMASLGEDVPTGAGHRRHANTIIHPAIKKYDPLTYPVYRDLLEVVTSWNPDDPEPPATFRETLQHFNYSDERERAMAKEYHAAEVPFKFYDVPDFSSVSKKWTDEYLSKQFKSIHPHVEKSNTNHFMYWNIGVGNRKRDYKPPTEVITDMTFDQWLQLARAADVKKLTNTSAHYYFMTGSSKHDRVGGTHFVARDLKPFAETRKATDFVTNPSANKGIQCRFGMRGIIAESHYDCGKNMIALMRGSKRYIINPPSACEKLGIIKDSSHPSYRHSVFDWSDPAQARSQHFEQVDAIDTIVQQGEILYVPSYWFHYVISLEYSIQCNSRSGTPPSKVGENHINKCMGEKLRRRDIVGGHWARGKS